MEKLPNANAVLRVDNKDDYRDAHRRVGVVQLVVDPAGCRGQQSQRHQRPERIADPDQQADDAGDKCSAGEEGRDVR
jgi:hypothetical protein